MELTSRHWLRAGVITVVLLVQALYAAPLPHRLRARDLKEPEVQDELTRWAAALGTDADTLSGWLVPFTGAVADSARAVRAPFRPALVFAGVGQSWAMFATPDGWPHRLEIDLWVDERWQPLYRRWDPAPWRNGALRNRRVRGIYDGAADRETPAYWSFTRWVAREALLEHPEASAVRIQLVRTHTTAPGVAPDPDEEPRLIRVHKRTAILPDDGLVP